MSEVVDLASIIPESRYIRYPGIDGDIEVKPPTTAQVLIMGACSERLGKKAELSDDEIRANSDRMVNAIKDCIPELKDKDLSSAVVDQLFFILSEMAMPDVAPELEKRGLEQADPKAQ